MQVIFAGDFFQLPPIVKRETEESTHRFALDKVASFAYNSPVWTGLNPIVCYLTGQYRQDDSDFLNLLSAIRRNAFGNDHLRHIEKRKIERGAIPDNIPKLFSHNADVDRINDEVLAKLQGEPHEFVMSLQGPDALVAVLKKGCLSKETLYLKVGAAVMFTKNNPKEGFVNVSGGKLRPTSIGKSDT